MPRPAFEPTGDQRHTVAVLCGMGLTHLQISQCILNSAGKPIDLKTLRKHFKIELETGASTTSAKVSETLYVRAMAGDAQLIKFYMMNRMGWSNKDTAEHSGPGGGPIPVVQVPPGKIDLSTLSDDELAQAYRDRTQARS